MDLSNQQPDNNLNHHKVNKFILELLSYVAITITALNIVLLTVYIVQVYAKSQLYLIPMDYFVHDSLELKVFDAITGIVDVLYYKHVFRNVIILILSLVFFIDLLHIISKRRKKIYILKSVNFNNKVIAKIYMFIHNFKLQIPTWYKRYTFNKIKTSKISALLTELIIEFLLLIILCIIRCLEIIINFFKFTTLSAIVIYIIVFFIITLLLLPSIYYKQFWPAYIYNDKAYCQTINSSTKINTSEIIATDKSNAIIYRWVSDGVTFQSPESSGYIMKLTSDQLKNIRQNCNQYGSTTP